MKTLVLSKFKIIISGIVLVAAVSCKKDSGDVASSGPTLTLSGKIANGTLTATTNTKVMFSWTTTKGTASLVSFSIDKDGTFLTGWNAKALQASQSATYTDSTEVDIPDTEGSYTYTLTVTDEKNKTAKQTVEVTATKPVITITDAFVYFNNSTFLFVIKDGTTSVATTKMTWTVTGYNSSTNVATLTKTLDPSTTATPLPATFYLRKAASGALEYSSDAGNWSNLTDNSGSVNFLFGVKAAKPSSLLGSVNNGIQSSTVSYPEGSSTGYMVFSEYNASGNDNYMFTDYSKEYYCEATGFTDATTYTYDGSSYPPFIYKREVELVYYKIYLPNGTTREGGSKKPDAPSNLSGTYYYRVDSWNSNTGMYEKHSYISLQWTDNSNNEIQFDVYIKADDNNFYHLSEINNVYLIPDNFPANYVSGIVRQGYYVDWGKGTYYFKLKAVSATDESDFSNEASVTVY
jgi:hypothetical protein